MREAGFRRAVQRILELEKNLLVYCEGDLPDEQLDKVIDVWWYSKDNGSLMVTLAHLIQTSSRWRDHRVRVLRIVQSEAAREETRTTLEQRLTDMRLQADVEVIVSDANPLTVIAQTSRMSAVCFVGLKLGEVSDETSPLSLYEPLVAEAQGHLFLTKSWQALQH